MLPQWVLRLNSRNRLSAERSDLLSMTSIATDDTEVALKIVVGRVRYRAQRRGTTNTYSHKCVRSNSANENP